MRLFGKYYTKSEACEKTHARIDDVKGHVKVVRTLTLPSGKKVRVIRKDAFDRALAKSKIVAEAS